jgi:hypothetical protein
MLRPLLSDPLQTPVLGYLNQGGTLDVQGMLFANKCTWVHVLAAAANGLGEPPDTLLSADEFGALMGETGPEAIFEPALQHVE